MRRFITPVLAALAAVAVSAPVVAETNRVDIPVAYGDLDLSQPEHVAILKDRLHEAAMVACARLPESALVPNSGVPSCTTATYHRALVALAKLVPQQVALRD